MNAYAATEYHTWYAINATVAALFFVNFCMVGVSTSAVILRLFGRLDAGAPFEADDYFAIASSVQGIALLAVQAWFMNLGEGFPMPWRDDTLGNLVVIKKLLIAFQLLYATTTMCYKLSVLFLYLRIFCRRFSNNLKALVRGVMAFVLLWWVANIFKVFFICQPFEATFDNNVIGKCGNQIASYVAVGCFNTISDIIVLLLPIPTLWSLTLKLAYKIFISIIFLLGFSATSIAIVRMLSISQDLKLETLTQSMVWPVFWTNMEVNIALICINAPAVGFFVSNLQSMLGQLRARRVDAERGMARPARERVPSPFPSLANPRVPFGQNGPFEEIELRPQIYSPTAPPPPRYGLRAIPNPMFANRTRYQSTSRCERVDRDESDEVPVGGIGVRTEWAVEFSGERS